MGEDILLCQWTPTDSSWVITRERGTIRTPNMEYNIFISLNVVCICASRTVECKLDWSHKFQYTLDEEIDF